ncbi:MAG: hypothetical protein GY757_42810 [bacterium]|nr:hypothetical protein [bacterium]
MSSKNPQKTLTLATIAEGERRFFDIKLRKGCLIKGTVYIKDQTGVRPLIPTDEFYPDNVEIYIVRIVTPEEKCVYPFKWVEYDEVFLDKKGNYSINGVMPLHSYSIWYTYKEYARHIKNLQVKNEHALEINHTFDDTDKSGISLKVLKDSERGHADIDVAQAPEWIIIGSLKLVNDRYIMKNMIPGTYKLYLSVYLPDKSINKVIPVKIEKGVTKFLDLNY